MWQFFALHFWGFFSSFSALGILIAVGLFVVFGWELGGVVRAALGLAKAAFRFFETPLGEAIAVIALVVITALATSIYQIRKDEAAYKIKLERALTEAAQRAETARIARDAYVKQTVKVDADKRIADIEAQKQEMEQKADDYAKALEARPACRVTPHDLKRLRKP